MFKVGDKVKVNAAALKQYQYFSADAVYTVEATGPEVPLDAWRHRDEQKIWLKEVKRNGNENEHAWFYAYRFFLAPVEAIPVPEVIEHKGDFFDVPPAPIVPVPPAKHMYKKGDKVWIVDPKINDLKANGFIPEMDEFKGKVVTLAEPAHHAKCWMMEEIRWSWHEDSFELYVKQEDNELKHLNYDSLRHRASVNKIPGRGRMNKAGLLAALIAQQEQAKAAKAAIIQPVVEAPPPKVLTTGWLLRQKTGNSPGTCSYVLIDTGGREYWHVKDICHARLRIYGKGAKEIVLDIGGHHHVIKEKEWYVKFVDYLLNRSPFASAFLTKDVNNALISGVYMDVENVSHSRIATAAVALREVSEFTYRLDVWKKVIEMGYSEKAAHIAFQFFQKDGENLRFHLPSGWHQTVSATVDKADYLKTYKEGFHTNPGDVPSIKNAADYRIQASLGNEYSNDGIGSYMMKLFEQDIKKPAKFGEKIPLGISIRTFCKGMEEIERILNEPAVVIQPPVVAKPAAKELEDLPF